MGAAVAAARAPRRAPVLLAAALVAVAVLAGAHALFWVVHGGRWGFWSGGLSSLGGLALALAALLIGRPCTLGGLRLRLGRPRAARASSDGGSTAWPMTRRSRT